MAKQSSGNPFLDFDISKTLGDFKVPGLDVEAIMASQRKNIEAVTAANQLAIEGLQAVLRRQAEILRASVEESSNYVNQVVAAGTPEEKAAKQTELAKAAFEKALANARELAELVAKSNSEAAEILSKRVSESLDEVKAAIAKTQSARK
ncbi:phasin family protein [Azospirillum soli]|uniref:phasin family protein n=1 Tax=Azospirillum soli TaxID=1304799 RepID=UPI001AE7781A|nr:phasin family protein [Azospirillum soli]MBP2313056.1 phasin family protein [Azospirillum soli]